MRTCKVRVWRGAPSRPRRDWKPPTLPPPEPAKLILRRDWPRPLRFISTFRRPDHPGIGTTLYKVIPPSKRAMLDRALKRVGLDCRCADHAAWLDQHFPYRHKIVLVERAGAGDAVAMTALPRDLHAEYPDQFQIWVDTEFRDAWRNNPHIIDGQAPPDARRVDVTGYTFDRELHFAHMDMLNFCRRTGLPEQTLRQLKPDLHLSKAESEQRPIAGPYWIIGEGGLYSSSAKWWDHYQAVIDATPQIQWVQVGHVGDGHFHQSLRGTIDLLGKTTPRQLMQLVAHSAGVLCSVTSLMHLAAGFDRPCVVIAGGREQEYFYRYPGHVVFESAGKMPYCQTNGCWKYRCWVEPGQTHDACPHPVPFGEVTVPRCMHEITAEPVVEAIHAIHQSMRPALLGV